MKNNNYKYRSGNIKNINRLLPITGNFRHAMALDQFAFYSINSTFVLPKQSEAEGWFRIGYSEIANTLGYKDGRSITSIVKKFITLGLIEKERPLIGSTNTACIRITEKTKTLLGFVPCEKPQENPTKTSETQSNHEEERKNFDQNFTSESEKISLPYKEKRVKEKDINIITPSEGCEKQEQRYNVPEQVEVIFKKIGERLPEQQKTDIWAAICNLQKQHKKQISNIAEFTAWVAFSIINARHQLKSAKTFTHQLNQLMAIARSKEGLKKPRGFNNHWDVGQQLKQKDEEQIERHELSKRMAPETSSRKDKRPSGTVYSQAKPTLWKQDSDILFLKSRESELKMELHALAGGLKHDERLFARKPDELERSRQITHEKMKPLKEQLDFICEQIRLYEAEKMQSLENEWQPLYVSQ